VGKGGKTEGTSKIRGLHCVGRVSRGGKRKEFIISRRRGKVDPNIAGQAPRKEGEGNRKEGRKKGGGNEKKGFTLIDDSCEKGEDHPLLDQKPWRAVLHYAGEREGEGGDPLMIPEGNQKEGNQFY